MEAQMLNVLGFKVGTPSSHVFLARFLKAAQADTNLRNMSLYINERALQEYSMLAYKPSMIAAASVNLARRTLYQYQHQHQYQQAWTPLLEKHSLYNEAAISPAVRDLSNIMNSSSSLKAVAKKYQNAKFGSVSSIPIPQL
jgi:cyclin A